MLIPVLIGSTLIIILVQTSFLVYRALHGVNARAGDILVDTSVLIDGRVLAIARSGLLTACLIVPRSVVRELQFMADKADHTKRERARFGLETIEKLQQIPSVSLKVIDDGLTNKYGVDEQLIVLARQTGAKLCTIDYNLNKAARVQGVEVVNINELAHALRVVVLPGERIKVALVQAGQDKKQAVGYLDDGTMVVVDEARDLISTEVEVEITRALQTAAGRMMFARLIATEKVPKRTKQTKASPVGHSQVRKKEPRSQVGTTRRRTTPEDALVSLANDTRSTISSSRN